MGEKLLIAVILIISVILSGCMEKPEIGVQPVPTPTVKPNESTQEFEVIPQREPEGLKAEFTWWVHTEAFDNISHPQD